MSIHVTRCLTRTIIPFGVVFQFISIHVTCSLPKTSIPFSVVFPVHVNSRYFLSPKYQHSLQCCVPTSCTFKLIAVSQTEALPSELCSQFMSFHVTCCLQRPAFPLVLCSHFTSIHVTCCRPKTSILFSVVFPDHDNSRYLLSPKYQHTLQCCVPNSCPFTLLAVSQTAALPSVLCSQFMYIHVTCCIPKTIIPFIVVFPVYVLSRNLLSPKHQHSLQCCVRSLCPSRYLLSPEDQHSHRGCVPTLFSFV